VNLVELLGVQHEHRECEDCWYSCALLTCDDDRKGSECDCGANEINALHAKALSHIESQDKRIRELEGALKPFAEFVFGPKYGGHDIGPMHMVVVHHNAEGEQTGLVVTMQDFANAKRVLSEGNKP